MRCFTLLFTRRGRSQSHDDEVYVSPYEGSRSIFEVVYKTPELTRDRRFLASFSGVLQYLEDIMMSMRSDVDPFEQIQLNTAIHPSVMFHVSDMDDSETRDVIINMIGDSLRFEVTSRARE
jgi:hypothetical protein